MNQIKFHYLSSQKNKIIIYSTNRLNIGRFIFESFKLNVGF